MRRAPYADAGLLLRGDCQGYVASDCTARMESLCNGFLLAMCVKWLVKYKQTRNTGTRKSLARVRKLSRYKARITLGNKQMRKPFKSVRANGRSWGFPYLI